MSDERTDQQATSGRCGAPGRHLDGRCGDHRPKSGGQLFLAGKLAFLETVIIDDPEPRAELASV